MAVLPSFLYCLLALKKNRLLSIDFQIFDMKQVMYVTLKDFFFKEGNYQLIGGGAVPVHFSLVYNKLIF